MGILLSGVGDDGIRGIRHIKQLGGVTVALDEKTSTITSMAREAVATGDVDFVLAPDQIRRKLIDHLDKAASG
jgi:chemotaxis response regulator CheB